MPLGVYTLLPMSERSRQRSLYLSSHSDEGLHMGREAIHGIQESDVLPWALDTPMYDRKDLFHV